MPVRLRTAPRPRPARRSSSGVSSVDPRAKATLPVAASDWFSARRAGSAQPRAAPWVRGQYEMQPEGLRPARPSPSGWGDGWQSATQGVALGYALPALRAENRTHRSRGSRFGRLAIRIHVTDITWAP